MIADQVLFLLREEEKFMRSLDDPITMLAGVGEKEQLVLPAWASKRLKTY